MAENDEYHFDCVAAFYGVHRTYFLHAKGGGVYELQVTTADGGNTGSIVWLDHGRPGTPWQVGAGIAEKLERHYGQM